MQTVRLPPVHASVIKDQMSAPGVPQVNRFEQVYGLGHQISPPEVGTRMRAGGLLYGKVQYIMGNGHMDFPL